MRGPALLLSSLLATLFFAGCLEGNGAGGPANEVEAAPVVPPLNSHPAYGFPVYLPDDGQLAGNWPLPKAKPLPDPLRGISIVEHVEGTSTGGGIAVFSTWAFIGQRTQGPLEVIDISDPAAPKLVGKAEGVPVRDADTIAFPDGRLVVITTAGGRVQFATDVTDPANPRKIAEIETPHGNHNIAVVPGTPIVYNSGSAGVIDIVDYSYPADPRIVGEFQNGNGCHDTTFYISVAEEKYRAYCAGYGESQIWDIADPKAPRKIIGIPFPTVEKGVPVAGGSLPATQPHPSSFSHLAMVNHDATVLIVGDETGGGGSNQCDVYAQLPTGQSVSGPIGNLWFYDLKDEKKPVLQGHVSPSAADGVPGSCTAHFGRLVEDTGFLVMGFYAAGVSLVDFRDPDNPKIVYQYNPATESGSIWDVWYYQGYLFTGDMSRGMDVLTLT